MKMSGLKPGARNIGRSSTRAQEAAGFARKLDNAERGEGRPRAPGSLSLIVASFVLSDSNKTQNSSQAAANKLAALS